MTNVEAVDATLVALGDRLSDDLTAFIAALRGLAGLVDADPSNLSAWREYRLMLSAFQEVIGDDVDDNIADLVASFGKAEVRN